MQGFGQRLRRRARELGLSDSEVARRLGLQQSRYAHYVLDTREPDMSTLLRICRLLGTSPNALLGYEAERRSADAAVSDRIAAAVEAMPPEGRALAAELMDTLAGHQGLGTKAAKGAASPRAKRARKRR